MSLKFGDRILVKQNTYAYCGQLGLSKPSDEYYFYRWGEPSCPGSKKFCQVYERKTPPCGAHHPTTRAVSLIVFDDPTLHDDYMKAWDTVITYNELYLATNDRSIIYLWNAAWATVADLECQMNKKR